MEEISDTLDLSNKKLKKLNKPTIQETQITSLILDDNELSRLDNIDSYVKLQKLSAVRNQLLRMYGVCRLHSLHTLNLAHNGILTIEGLKELVNLKWLCLAGNTIKIIEHLNTNVNLEHLDLSENSITNINDLSFLKNLKELLLHNNKIAHLRQCDRFLPVSITTLTLANNNITDLNEVSQLVHLTNLTSLSIVNNPCVNMTGNNIGFDYRPFIINWCMNVNVIDGYVVDAIESLRAEWLYSQGRGRHFRVGDQQELVQYLATVCPITGEQLETEEDRKLRLILSKAQHHQQQLRDQQSNPDSAVPSPAMRKKLHGSRFSPRISSSRLSNRSKSPDRMTSSCYLMNTSNDSSSTMTQSLDPSMFRQSVLTKSATEVSNGFLNNDKYTEAINSPLQALSEMVPVPETLMSPDYRPPSLVGSRLNTPSTIPTHISMRTPTKVAQPVRSPKSARTVPVRTKNLSNDIRKSNSPSPARQRKFANNSPTMKKDATLKTSILKKSPQTSDDESEVYNSKLQTIQMKAEERRHQKDTELYSNSSMEEKVEQAAVCIQKMWRGYYTRNRNKEIQEMFKTLQSQRADQYIRKLATDMETTKAALESERKIQMLQTEAITALWKKVSALQPAQTSGESSSPNINMTNLSSNDNTEVVKQLAQTCSMLQNQIQQLQSSMQDIVRGMSVFSQASQIPVSNNHNFDGTATQTEIIAVHTPQGEAGKLFPFHKQLRPSSLPLPVSQRKKENTPNTNSVNSELRQYAGTLAEGVIKTLSEPKNIETTEQTPNTANQVVETQHEQNAPEEQNIEEVILDK